MLEKFFASILSDYLANQGIVHKSLCINTPQQNGIEERKKPTSARYC